MCGIVGLFLKDKSLESALGTMLTAMLVTMTNRGSDSAGIAIYSDATPTKVKLTVQSSTPEADFVGLSEEMQKVLGSAVSVTARDSHAVIEVASDQAGMARAALTQMRPNVRVMSIGESIEIYKEVGQPAAVAQRFNIDRMSGTHGIGHTRMATESAVTTMGAHPFSTGPDQCLVHNGSLSNHNALRRKLRGDGVGFETDNDSEVAAAFLTREMHNGSTLGEALESSLKDLDGFFTFVVGTRDGFGVLRDPIACKPAVMAETDQYVAFGSEYRVLVDLPGIETARVWEPEPATVYFWSYDPAPGSNRQAA